MPINFGRLDWSSWLYGLLAGFFGGGAGAVTSGFANMVVDPEHFNILHPRLVIESMVTMFVISGVLTALAFLHQNPLPTVVTVTETKTTSLQKDPPAIVEQIVKTTEAKPVEEQPK